LCLNRCPLSAPKCPRGQQLVASRPVDIHELIRRMNNNEHIHYDEPQ